MGGISIWQIAIVALLAVLLLGRGKISGLMGDVAAGIKTFKKGLADDDTPDALESPSHAPEPADKTAHADQSRA